MAEGTYAAAGVNIDAQDQTIELIKAAVRSTYTPAVVTDIGSFGGLYALPPETLRQPLLVSSIDSVGTKVKLASMAGVYDTVGVDLVHHCVNDIAVMGAEPLFFLDYYGTGRHEPAVASAVICSLAEACRGVGCALIGGELAELPGMYPPGEFDLVGAIVGLVQRDQVIDGVGVVAGDALLGLASSGLHTNGYSLARKILLTDARLGLDAQLPELDRPLGDVLLEPHRCYLSALRKLRSAGLVKAAAHITGGGLLDNVPRVLPEGLGAEFWRGSWAEPAIFGLMAARGQVAEREMFRTFNMGVGLVVAVAADRVAEALAVLADEEYSVTEVGVVSADVEDVVIHPARS